MQLFYAPHWSKTEPFALSEDESRHAISSLRYKIGDKLTVIDGYGSKVMTELISANPKKTMLRFLSVEISEKKSNNLHIAISPTKNNDRIEWFIEKACEIGVGKITPIVFERTERNKINKERWEKIVVSSCKQSQQLFFPQIGDLMSLKLFMESMKEGNIYAAMIGAEETINSTNIETTKACTILVGPEGDFTDEEKEIIINKGIQPINLSENILRVETAGLVAVCQWNSVNK